VSVTAEFTLPAQPTSGTTTIRPLGGDGYSSPQNMYLCTIPKTCDASGGTCTITINMDPQFQSVIGLMQTSLTSAAADRLVKLGIFPDGFATGFSVQALQVVDADVGSNLMYSPPPVFNPTKVVATVDNVDTEVFRLSLLVYNFKRDAFQKVPLNVLLASLPRGFDII